MSTIYNNTLNKDGYNYGRLNKEGYNCSRLSLFNMYYTVSALACSRRGGNE